MTIPATVEALLRTNNVDYAVAELQPTISLAELHQNSDVRTTLLRNGKGLYQVLYPADCLLDIQALCRAVGQQLHPASAADVQKVLGSQRLEAVPAVPGVLGLPTYVDKRLLDAQQLAAESGSRDSVLRFSRDGFQLLAASATVGDFSIPLADLEASRLAEVDDLTTITRAVANFTELRIKQRLEETLEFPPLPDTAQRIIKLRIDPYADIKDLTDIVETDPPLAAQVVSWAASPYYAAPGKIKSVHDAIVRVLGFDLVLNLALGLALGKTMAMPKDAPMGITPYWNQSVYGATAVESLVTAIPVEHRPTMGLAYLSGLLHNFGYLILAEVFPPYFTQYCRAKEVNPEANHAHIERHLIGVTRDQLAGWLMRMWEMPPEVCTALRYQNDPDYQGEHAQYAALIYVATRLLREHGIGDGPLEPIPAAFFERLHLTPEKARDVIQGVIDSGEQLRAIAANLAA